MFSFPFAEFFKRIQKAGKVTPADEVRYRKEYGARMSKKWHNPNKSDLDRMHFGTFSPRKKLRNEQ